VRISTGTSLPAARNARSRSIPPAPDSPGSSNTTA
jgi:hypothetical protein